MLVEGILGLKGCFAVSLDGFDLDLVWLLESKTILSRALELLI